MRSAVEVPWRTPETEKERNFRLMDPKKIVPPWHTDTASVHTDKAVTGHTDVVTGPHTDVKGHSDIPQIHDDVTKPHIDHADKPV
jgi:hypothetical protein